jgi:hypothetical protein
MHHGRHGGQDLAEALLRSGSQGRSRQAHAEAHQTGDDRDKRWGAPCSRLPFCDLALPWLSLRRYPSPLVRQHQPAHGAWVYGSKELDRPEPAMPDGRGRWWPLTQQGIAFRDRSVARPLSGASRTGLLEGLAGS